MFSGGLYQKADVITGIDYPFLTGKSGELNFASQLEAKPSISSLYAFVSLFSFYNLNYLLQDDLKNYFVLYDGNLDELASFHNTISKDVYQLKNQTFVALKLRLSEHYMKQKAFSTSYFLFISK